MAGNRYLKLRIKLLSVLIIQKLLYPYTDTV